jgi:hypothetical protein
MPGAPGLPQRLLNRADDVLRGRASSGDAWLVLGCGMAYGAVMGSYGGRGLQSVYSALKVPLLLMVTAGIGMPSFFVLNTLLGLRDDLPRAVRSLIGAQAGLTVILVSLAPITAFWYASVANYRSAILFNGVMFAVASLGAQFLLRRSYQPLIAQNRRHRLMLRAWLVVYVFVGIQMGWVLRPFIGDPENPVQFFRADAWDNAYVLVVTMIWEKIAR